MKRLTERGGSVTLRIRKEVIFLSTSKGFCLRQVLWGTLLGLHLSHVDTAETRYRGEHPRIGKTTA